MCKQNNPRSSDQGLYVCLSSANYLLTLFILDTCNLQTGTLANCEDPDEMPHNVAFHQGLHCLQKHHDLEISTIEPLKYKMGNSILILSTM